MACDIEPASQSTSCSTRMKNWGFCPPVIFTIRGEFLGGGSVTISSSGIDIYDKNINFTSLTTNSITYIILRINFFGNVITFVTTSKQIHKHLKSFLLFHVWIWNSNNVMKSKISYIPNSVVTDNNKFWIGLFFNPLPYWKIAGIHSLHFLRCL